MAPWLSWLTMQLILMALSGSGYSQHYVETDQGRLHYFEAAGSGSGAPVVLLHGIGSQASDLYTVMERLRPQVRKVIAIDLPGHGWSEVPVSELPLEQVQASIYQGLDRLLAKEEPVQLFGNSLGGWQALRYALHNPAEIKSLVLVSPAGGRVDGQEAERLRQVFVEDSVQRPERMIELLYNEQPAWAPAARPFLYSRFNAPGVRAWVGLLNEDSFYSQDQVAAMARLPMPVLLIWGQQDKIFPVEAGFFKHALPTTTRVLEPAHFTHSPYIEGEMDRELAGLMQDWNLALDGDQKAGGTLAAPAP